jgi:Protein of unknown function (DUF3604)
MVWLGLLRLAWVQLVPFGRRINQELLTSAQCLAHVADSWRTKRKGSEADLTTDPDFDLAQRAFYYGRVLEIPTPQPLTMQNIST